MNNKIVYSMYQIFIKHGFSSLRFNFRGVGRSQGQFDNGQGELSDAASALDWMQSSPRSKLPERQSSESVPISAMR
jgi:alpha/beta superfamily hydrolase